MKVCVEVAIMASDAGLIPIDLNVISIAGTSRGRCCFADKTPEFLELL